MKLFKLIIFLTAAMALSTLAANFFPPWIIEKFAGFPAKIFVVTLSVLIFLDIVLEIYVFVHEVSPKKVIFKVLSYCLVIMSGISLVAGATFPFQEARIRASFEKGMQGKTFPAEAVRAYVDGTIKASASSAAIDMFPYFLTVGSMVVVLVAFYMWVDTLQNQAREDLKARRAKKAARK